MNSDISFKKERIASKLRPHSGIVLHTRALLTWEKPYYASILVSVITLFFLLFWLIDTSVLSKICIFAIMLIIIDFVLPFISKLVQPTEWLDEYETKYQNFCERIAIAWSQVASSYQVYSKMKKTNTKIFYVSLLTTLLILAWLGSIIHNLLLTYIFVLGVVLYPGLSKQESFQRGISKIILRLIALLPKSEKNKE